MVQVFSFFYVCIMRGKVTFGAVSICQQIVIAGYDQIFKTGMKIFIAFLFIMYIAGCNGQDGDSPYRDLLSADPFAPITDSIRRSEEHTSELQSL